MPIGTIIVCHVLNTKNFLIIIIKNKRLKIDAPLPFKSPILVIKVPMASASKTRPASIKLLLFTLSLTFNNFRAILDPTNNPKPNDEKYSK